MKLTSNVYSRYRVIFCLTLLICTACLACVITYLVVDAVRIGLQVTRKLHLYHAIWLTQEAINMMVGVSNDDITMQLRGVAIVVLGVNNCKFGKISCNSVGPKLKVADTPLR